MLVDDLTREANHAPLGPKKLFRFLSQLMIRNSANAITKKIDMPALEFPPH